MHMQMALKDQFIGPIFFRALQEWNIPIKIILLTVLSKFA